MQVPSKSFGMKSPGKGKQKKSETPAKAAIKRRVEFEDESVVLPKGRGIYFDDSNFATALRDGDKTVSSRRGGRSCASLSVKSPIIDHIKIFEIMF